MFGVKIDPVHKQQILTTVRCASGARQGKKAARSEREKLEKEIFDYDDYSESVVGYLELEEYDPSYSLHNSELCFEPDDDDSDIPF